MYGHLGSSKKRDKKLALATYTISNNGDNGICWRIDYLSFIDINYLLLNMIQEIAVVLLLILSLAYLGYRVNRKFFSKAKGCDTCAFSGKEKIEPLN
jgi:hypothetical protein